MLRKLLPQSMYFKISLRSVVINPQYFYILCHEKPQVFPPLGVLFSIYVIYGVFYRESFSQFILS